jgi:YVTN family beta-propeller protein
MHRPCWLLFTLALCCPAHRAQEAAAVQTSAAAERAPQTTTWAAPRPVAAAHPELRPPTASFVSTDDAPEGDMPRNLAFLPDGSAVVIANRDTDTVTFLNVATRQITHTVAVGDFPVHVAVTPDGKHALVPNVFGNSVSVIDVPTHTLAATIAITGQQPYRIATTSDSKFAVVGVINDAVASTFSVLDLTTLTEVRTFASAPQGVFGAFFTPESGIFGNIFTQFALAADDRTIVYPSRGQSRIAMYDLVTGLEVASLPGAALPTAVDISADGAVAVVSHEGTSNTITEIDVAARAVTGTFATASNLNNQVIRITPSKSHAMAAILNAMIFVDLTTGATTATISTGTVGDIEISFDGRYAFVSNFNARVIDIPTQTLVRTITFEACAEAAASPTQYRAVALDNRFRENALVFDINGASAFFEGKVQSGPPNEGDATRTLAISPDGRTVIANNNISENVALLDLAAGSVLGYVPTGDRVWDAAFTPNGAFAVVTNTESDTVSVIDVAARARVAQLAVGSRPTEVAVSPDGTKAYVTTVAGTDRLHFISLAGAGSSVTGSITTGQLGTIGYTYSVASGIGLSPDGKTLAVCVSFDDQLMLVDTTTSTEVARLAVGDFPIQVAFSPDSSKAYVTHSFGDNVYVINIAGAASSVAAIVPGIEFPLSVNVDDTGSFVYVGSFDFAAPKVVVISKATNTIVRTVAVASQPRSAHLSAIDDTLYVTLTGGSLVRIRAAGAATTLIDSMPLTDSPADLVFSESLRRAVVAQPGARDGVDVIAYGGVFAPYGAGLAGSGGLTPQLAGSGTPSPGGAIALNVTQGLGAAPGVLLIGTSAISFPLFGGTILALPIGSAPHALGGASGVPGAGTISMPFLVPLDALGVRLFFQSLYLDGGAVQGLSMTAGLELVIG